MNLELDRCPLCSRPAHASESNDDGVCVDCLGDAAILPEDQLTISPQVATRLRRAHGRERRNDPANLKTLDQLVYCPVCGAADLPSRIGRECFGFQCSGTFRALSENVLS